MRSSFALNLLLSFRYADMAVYREVFFPFLECSVRLYAQTTLNNTL